MIYEQTKAKKQAVTKAGVQSKSGTINSPDICSGKKAEEKKGLYIFFYTVKKDLLGGNLKGGKLIYGTLKKCKYRFIEVVFKQISTKTACQSTEKKKSDRKFGISSQWEMAFAFWK